MWDDKPNSVSRLQTGHLATNLFHNPCHGRAGHDDHEVDNDSDSDSDSDEDDYGNGGDGDDDGDDDGGDDGDGVDDDDGDDDESNLCHLVQVWQETVGTCSGCNDLPDQHFDWWFF